jgi:Family of unknown function (DUF6476)
MTKSDEPVVVAPPKWLKALVYTMGIVLVALFVAMVVLIVYKVKHRPPVVVENIEMGIGLPPDAQFKDVTLNGDRLTVSTGKSVYVIDVPSHKVILRINGLQD